jgi:hypothetical protein
MGIFQNQQFCDEIVIEMKIQSGLDEPVELLPRYQKPLEQKLKSAANSVLYFSTVIFDNSPSRSRAISSERS